MALNGVWAGTPGRDSGTARARALANRYRPRMTSIDPTDRREEVKGMAAKRPVKMKTRKTTGRARATKKASPRAIRQAKRVPQIESLRVTLEDGE